MVSTNKRLALAAALGGLLGHVRSFESGEFPTAEDAKTEVELEHTWYGQLEDRSVLEKASSVEKQEQWSVPAKPGDDCLYNGSIRVRKSERDGTVSYMMCVKAFEHKKLGCLENEFEINETTFNQFKRVAGSGMIKTRYTFPIEGTEYAFEVDVFQETDWVKVDLEVDDSKFAIPELPISLNGLIKDTPTKRTPEQEKMIDELMTRYFRCENPFKIER